MTLIKEKKLNTTKRRGFKLQTENKTNKTSLKNAVKKIKYWYCARNKSGSKYGFFIKTQEKGLSEKT